MKSGYFQFEVRWFNYISCYDTVMQLADSVIVMYYKMFQSMLFFNTCTCIIKETRTLIMLMLCSSRFM